MNQKFGLHTFEFSGSKPVVLIGGMNGRGKTTFLEAILLALYGSNSFAYNESKYRTYGQYLKAYVNRADGSLESIKALLGITVLDSLGNDISRIITKTTKAASNPMEAKELETLRDKKAQADSALQAADDRIADLAAQLDGTNKNLEKAKTDYAAKGGDIVAQRQDLFNQRSRLTLRIEQEQEKLISAAAGELPLMLVKDLLVDIQAQASKEHESRVTALAVSKINTAFSAYASMSGKDAKAIMLSLRGRSTLSRLLLSTRRY